QRELGQNGRVPARPEAPLVVLREARQRRRNLDGQQRRGAGLREERVVRRVAREALLQREELRDAERNGLEQAVVPVELVADTRRAVELVVGPLEALVVEETRRDGAEAAALAGGAPGEAAQIRPLVDLRIR